MSGLLTVLALDFDGVLCDGLKEYFQTSWKAYCHLWQSNGAPPAGLAEQFYRLRPVILTGWEMPVLVRALVTGVAEAEIEQHWPTIAQTILKSDGLAATQLATEVDTIRDQWIAADLDDWLAEHTFYPGVIDRLKSIDPSSTKALIISTKEKRFIQQLLQQQGVDVEQLKIFGKETRKPKHQILRELIAESPATEFWFVEDRLETLREICTYPDLAKVQLFLANWGYNTQAERNSIAADSPITLLSLEQFGQDFSAWTAQQKSRN